MTSLGSTGLANDVSVLEVHSCDCASGDPGDAAAGIGRLAGGWLLMLAIEGRNFRVSPPFSQEQMAAAGRLQANSATL